MILVQGRQGQEDPLGSLARQLSGIGDPSKWRERLPSLWPANRLAHIWTLRCIPRTQSIHTCICMYILKNHKKLRKFFQENLSFLCVSILQQCDLKSSFTIPLTLVTWRCGWTEGLQPLVLTMNTHALPNQRQEFGCMWLGLFNNHPCSINEVTLAEKKT